MIFNRRAQLKHADIKHFPFTAVALATMIAVNTSITCAFAADNVTPVDSAFLLPAETKLLQSTAEPVASTQSESVSPTANMQKETTQQSVTNDGQKNSSTTAANTTAANAASDKLLHGSVIRDTKKSPFLTGSLQAIPPGTRVDVVFTGNVNSETSQKGDEVFVQVACDVPGSNGVGVPGGWMMHGLVTDSSGQKRLGRDGHVEIEFDKLISPNGEYELPFHATVSTKDCLMKSIAKVAAIDSGFVTKGAVGGSILSVQMTGLPVAIATHGYSVAIGAGIGASLGLFGALKRKGNILSIYPGAVMKMMTAETISLPGFDKSQLPSGQKHEALTTLGITINKTVYRKDPSGDRGTNLLVVDLTLNNKTAKEYKFRDLAVVSDLNQRYQPWIDQGFRALMEKSVAPHSEQEGVVTFEVGPKNRKYWLVLLDRIKECELKRVPLN